MRLEKNNLFKMSGACMVYVAVVCLGDFIEHFIRHINRFDRVHGWYGIGKMDFEEKMLFVFCLEKEL